MQPRWFFLLIFFIGGCSFLETETPSAEPLPPAPTYPSVAARLQALAGREPLDYADAANWGCAGEKGICAVPQTLTSVATDGTRTEITLTPDAGAPLDCFYLYPTVSWVEPAGNDDDLDYRETARETMESQAAPFAGACRVFAPFYRQVTLLTYSAAPAEAAPYFRNTMLDAASAFEYYLEHWNDGRPLVIIGHSQGAQMSTALLHLYFDGATGVTQIAGSRTSAELRERLVLGLPLGFNVFVPKGKKVGGSFSDIPLCTAAEETGCVIHYRSFPERPVYPTLSGNIWSGDQVLAGEGFLHRLYDATADEVACVNPAVGGVLAPDAVSDSAGKFVAPGEIRRLAGTNLHLTITGEEGFGMSFDREGVAVPGRYAATCREGALAIGLAAPPAADLDVRGDPLSMSAFRYVLTGLHQVDMHVTQGDLVEQVRRRGAAWQKNKVP